MIKVSPKMPKTVNGRSRISILDLGSYYSPSDFAAAAQITRSLPPGTNIHQVTQVLVADQIARRRFNRNGSLSTEERLQSILEKLAEAQYFNSLIPEGYRYADFELRLTELNEFHPVEYADDLEELDGNLGRLLADIRNLLWQLIKRAIEDQQRLGTPYGSLVQKVFKKGANACTNGNLSFLAGEVLPDLDARIRSEVQKRVFANTNDSLFERICGRFFGTPQPSEPLALGLAWSSPRSIDVVDGGGNIRSYQRTFQQKTRIDPGQNRVSDESGPAVKRQRQTKPLPYRRDRDGDVIFVDAEDSRSVRSEGSNPTSATSSNSTTASLRAAVD
ncbi:hypothetical protein HDU96_003034, partial [Phlyctochytrium bullatum]